MTVRELRQALAAIEDQESEAKIVAACQSAYRAIVLSNGRNVDWDVIVSELEAGMAQVAMSGVRS